MSPHPAAWSKARTPILVLVGALIAGIAWVSIGLNDSMSKFGYLWGNALQVAHPGYRIAFQGDVERHLFNTSMKVTIESHSAVISAESSERVAEVSKDLLGRIGVTNLPTDPMTDYLRTFRGGQGSDSKAKAVAVAQAESLKEKEVATVIVELSSPLLETEVERLTDFSVVEWKRFFLSGSRMPSGKPLYWWPGKGGCSATVLVDRHCSNRSAISQFRLWVRNFSDDDRANLAKLGLDLQALRDAASEGKVFGFIANVFDRDQALKLLDMPEVRTVDFVEREIDDER
ncbi:hypothetical protein [Nonomuraea sp. SYSU D8015]|uniref:hypothetical protein n=1 Tax=Nonomuraea sp. SYSU D8015 TaxID=2593644 RepID=UPI00166110F3|nr:hypothetical protein [Nonomuraea sp. SYSU D8015]